LLIATALATYPDPDFVTLQALVLRGVIPFMIYLSLVGVTLRQTDLSLLLSALALGSLVMFSRGALAFYWEWGFPDLIEISGPGMAWGFLSVFAEFA
jgi:hypothetical protein